MSDNYLKNFKFRTQRIELPELGQYATGILFLSQESYKQVEQIYVSNEQSSFNFRQKNHFVTWLEGYIYLNINLGQNI